MTEELPAPGKLNGGGAGSGPLPGGGGPRSLSLLPSMRAWEIASGRRWGWAAGDGNKMGSGRSGEKGQSPPAERRKEAPTAGDG